MQAARIQLHRLTDDYNQVHEAVPRVRSKARIPAKSQTRTLPRAPPKEEIKIEKPALPSDQPLEDHIYNEILVPFNVPGL